MRRLLTEYHAKPSNNSAHQTMVYMCECGTKWTDSTKPSWECKCGRQLVKRNGYIHVNTRRASGDVKRSQGSFGMAAGSSNG